MRARLRASPTFAPLRHRSYRRVAIATFVSSTGTWLQITGRAYLIYDVTGSKSALGAIYFFSYIPHLLLAPVAGAVTDRFDRRRLLVASQAMLAAGSLAIGVLAATGTASLVSVAALSVVMGAIQVVVQPATNSLLPVLVPEEELSGAVALHAAGQSVSRVVGPLLSALLIPALGVAWAFYGNALASMAIIVAWAATPVPAVVREEEGVGVLGAFAVGLRFLRRTPSVSHPIALLAVLCGIGLVYQPLTVAFATDVLAGGDDELGAGYYGLLQAVLGLGAIAGILGFAGIGRRLPRRTMAITGVGFGAAMVALGLTRTIVPALAAIFAVGAFHFANSTLVLAQVQHRTPDAVRGRVLAVYGMAWTGLFPVTSLVGGAVAERVGTRGTLAGAGVLCALGASVYAWRGAGADTPLARPRPPLPATSALAEADPVTGEVF